MTPETATDIDRRYFWSVVCTMIKNVEIMRNDLIAFIRARSTDQIADLAEVIIDENEEGLHDFVEKHVKIYRNDLEY